MGEEVGITAGLSSSEGGLHLCDFGLKTYLFGNEAGRNNDRGEKLQELLGLLSFGRWRAS